MHCMHYAMHAVSISGIVHLTPALKWLKLELKQPTSIPLPVWKCIFYAKQVHTHCNKQPSISTSLGQDMKRHFLDQGVGGDPKSLILVLFHFPTEVYPSFLRWPSKKLHCSRWWLPLTLELTNGFLLVYILKLTSLIISALAMTTHFSHP